MESQDRGIINSTIHGGKPFKSYKKTILGKVAVTAWNSFEGIAEGLLLYGDPKTQEDTASIDTWTAQEDFYFRTKNKLHLQTGNVVEFVRDTTPVEKTIEQFSDEELEAVLNEKFKKFFSLQTLLNSTTSLPLLFRIKNFAQDQERSEKVVKAIEARISEVQASEYKNPGPIEKQL